MDLGLFLILVGILVALLFSLTLGIVLIIIGAFVMFAPRLRR
jgi:hypothetical protein